MKRSIVSERLRRISSVKKQEKERPTWWKWFARRWICWNKRKLKERAGSDAKKGPSTKIPFLLFDDPRCVSVLWWNTWLMMIVKLFPSYHARWRLAAMLSLLNDQERNETDSFSSLDIGQHSGREKEIKNRRTNRCSLRLCVSISQVIEVIALEAIGLHTFTGISSTRLIITNK